MWLHSKDETDLSVSREPLTTPWHRALPDIPDRYFQLHFKCISWIERSPESSIDKVTPTV
jgi:hypothetical protein